MLYPLQCRGNYSATLNNMNVMYNVLSGLAACGRLGVAARPACLSVTRSGTRPAARVARTRRQQTESVECQ